MSEDGQMKTALGEQDYVMPQVYFPAVVTMKDPTEAEFIYILNNIMRTKRYGAQNTRTGTVENHLVGVVFADGEIFSNLQFTQAIYDALTQEQRAKTPLAQAVVLQAMTTTLPELLREDGAVTQLYMGEKLQALLEEVRQITSNEARLKEVLTQANAETNRYAQAHGVDAKEKKAKK